MSTQNLLAGLSGMKLSDLDLARIGPDSFENLSDTWNSVQIEAFRQSMQADSKATTAAATLNDLLREHGLLPLDRQVVGYFGGRFYTTSASDSIRRPREN
jgi:hypothetical protein